MIQHLTQETFECFGIILADESICGRPNHHSVFLPEGTVTEYRSVAPLWLAPEAERSVLGVSSDGVAYTEFYLDKAVRLQSGVWFRLTGFDGRSAVQMGSVSMPIFLGQRVNDRDFAVRPKVRAESLYTLFYQEKEAGFVFSGEAHPMAEMIYVDKGSLHSVADGKDLLLNRGELTIYAPGQWHMQYADGDQAPTMVTVSFWARGVDWMQLSNRRFRLKQASADLIQQMLDARENKETDRIFSLLTLLLLDLLAYAPDGDIQDVQLSVGAENTMIRKAQQYVQAHVTEKLTVPAVANGIGVSASYLTALFQKHLSLSPGEYIRRIKLGKSRQLIREGQMNFTQISELLQYSTVHHFSRQFKQMFGVTPTQYAKSVR